MRRPVMVSAFLYGKMSVMLMPVLIDSVLVE